jgi:organic radical activating enzyme
LERKLNNQIEVLQLIKDRQDEVGPGFCVLKWYHQEMHLGTGRAHSCYHCPTHKIPLDSDLHNTPHKIEQRETMLNGGKPKECSYCWEVEDLGLISDRQTLAAQFFKHDNKIDLKAVQAGTSYVYPKYLELSFTNKCQMACSYCGPVFSTTWEKEIEEHGPYKLTNLYNQIHTPQIEDSPYVKKFWKWFPKAYEHLFVLRVTGGEPLLDKNTYKLLQYVKDNPKEGLTFHCNSNLMVTENRVKKYIELVKDIPDAKLYVSIDSWGKQAEYIRHGLDINHFENNLHKVLGSGLQVGIMNTFNFLSIHNTEEFIYKMAELKNIYGNLITVDMPYMTEPFHLSAQISDDTHISNMENSLKLMETYPQFSQGEIEKFRKTVGWITANRFKNEELTKHRKDFWIFTKEHDKRRKTNFEETFPGLGFNDEETHTRQTKSISIK